MADKYNDSEFEDVAPAITLQGFLSGKQKLPPGLKGLQGPEIEMLNRQAAEELTAQAAGSVSAPIPGAQFLSKVGGKIRGGLNNLLGKAAKLTPEQTSVYAANPGAVEQTVKQFRTDPAALEVRVRDAIAPAVDKIAKTNQGLKSELNSAIAGTELSLNPATYKGTAAESMLEDIARKSGQIKSSKPTLGQTSEVVGASGQPLEVIGKQVHELGLPNKVGATGPQAQRMKEALQEASKFAPQGQVMPLDYAAKSAANREAARATRKAIEGVVPEAAEINKQIAEGTRYAKSAQRLSKNPAAILGDSVQKRALAQKLDEMGGSNLRQIADQVGVAKSKAFEPEGVLADTVKGISRMGIKAGTNAAKVVRPVVDTTSQMALRRLLGVSAPKPEPIAVKYSPDDFEDLP